jgi:hypothetical protein
MSATTIAVAVNHGTPVDGPPDAELGMTDSPPAPQHYTVQPKKIQQAFSTILAPPRPIGPTTQERPPAAGAGGRKKPRWPEDLLAGLLCVGHRFLLKLSGKPSGYCSSTC